MGAVLGLDHPGGSPVQLGEDYGAGGGEGETDASGCDAQYGDLYLGF